METLQHVVAEGVPVDTDGLITLRVSQNFNNDLDFSRDSKSGVALRQLKAVLCASEPNTSFE